MKKTLIPILFLIVGVAVLLTTLDLTRDRGDVAGTRVESEVKGLVLPHHNQAGAIIAAATEQLASFSQYETIVVLAPNHFKPDGPMLIVGDDLERFDIDQQLVSQLVETSNNIVIDNDLIVKEHGLLVPLEYLSASFPNAVFVPVMVSRNYTTKTLGDLARIFDGIIPDKALFVVSVDFSHDMLYEESMENTNLAAEVITAFDHDRLLTFDDRYMDAPVAVSLMMRIMSLREANVFQTWEMSHGAILFDNPLLQGTSYLTGVFQK